MDSRFTIGISSCLLGNPVRFDGGHKFDHWIVNTLGQYVDFYPVCPEVESGMTIPRETLRLVGDPENPRLVTTKSYQDCTEQVRSFSQKKVQDMESLPLCGFIFKRASPSSGMERVKVYKDVDPSLKENVGAPSLNGVGIFAREFMEHFPLIPVEEEGRLHDPMLRENFIERIFTMHRWRTMIESGATVGKLVSFHARHKLLIMSHSVEAYRSMGPLVAHAKEHPIEAVLAEYQVQLMRALTLRCTVKKHVNVLQHVMGYFKKNLSADEKQEILEIIDTFSQRLIPLIVPVTLLNHFVRKYDTEYLAEQYYLSPHPLELKLRNHA